VKPPKREPLLADKFLATAYADQSGVPRDFWESTRTDLRLAKRFVLSHDAATYCAQLLRDAPRILADAQEFAIPPFERTYIEIPFKTWFETITGVAADENGDQTVGYLITGSHVRCLVATNDRAIVMPFEYHLNEPMTPQQEEEFVRQFGTSRAALDVFYWGQSAGQFGTFVSNHEVVITDEWQMEGLRSLRENHGVSIHLKKSMAPRLRETWSKLSSASSGDLRNVIGLLLFLNRTKEMQYDRLEPFESRMIGNKSVTLLTHRTITLHVNPVPRLIQTLTAGEGIRRRLREHDVRGHLCHNEKARASYHDHEWMEADGPNLRWSCTCGARRWWRNSHKRGKGRGLVTTYKVTE
jgi:hypothetical protein